MAKDLFWVGRSLDDVRAFPAEARRKAGHQLHLIQLGLDPDDWRPMRSVGSGVSEIRLHGITEHRVLYVAKYPEAVYVLHAFEKRSWQTARRDIEIGRIRYKEILEWRREEGL